MNKPDLRTSTQEEYKAYLVWRGLDRIARNGAHEWMLKLVLEETADMGFIKGTVDQRMEQKAIFNNLMGKKALFTLDYYRERFAEDPDRAFATSVILLQEIAEAGLTMDDMKQATNVFGIAAAEYGIALADTDHDPKEDHNGSK